MSKKNVAEFIRKMSESPDLNKQVVAGERTPQAWVSMGKGAGLDYSADDVVQVLSELSGRKLSASDAVTAFIGSKDGELSEGQLSQVAGGAPVASLGGISAGQVKFSPQLFNRLGGLYGGGPVSQNFSEKVPGGTFFVKSGGSGGLTTLPGGF